MGLRTALPLMSVEEYLEGEKYASIRCEYVDGLVFPLAPSNVTHDLISAQLFRTLSKHLQDTGCGIFSLDIKLFVSPTVYYYPDVVVTRGTLPTFENICHDPILIVEVLSPQTEQTDRREKQNAYRGIPTLREYVLASQDQTKIEVYRRVEDDEWEVEMLDERDELFLSSVGLSHPVSAIYRPMRSDG